MLVGVASAWAGDLDTRVSLYEGLLDGARGDTELAVARYTELSRTLPDDDRSLGDALYWLGHGMYDLGRTEDARQALIDGIRTGTCSKCRDLLERLELDQSAVTTTPTLWSFEAGNPSIFHPWRVQEETRRIAVAAGPDGDAALAWTTEARLGDPDLLVIGLRDPTPPPESLRFDVRSDLLDAAIGTVVEDVHGRRFTTGAPSVVLHGTSRRMVVPFASLVPLDDGPPLDPSELVLVSIVDRTRSGVNRLWLDDVEIR
ncbi:MAG: hypothetical protein ABMA64_13750 [Myxococcota bacterium]